MPKHMKALHFMTLCGKRDCGLRPGLGGLILFVLIFAVGA
ncbi:hypothetical protein SAMN04488502_1229 [Dendrosporobacter quercicolus]|uniref:Uncharacterized protein n=1 Tax=Dendrosporobacter quercicolus TaxID=146817 RepID=A0A1H0ATL8_9FIRM|nr:hypothetical protein SAMN04488502_1229 [Dendrosporobacter quercicolus]